MMMNQENRLRQAVNQRKRVLINKLNKLDYFKTTDGLQVENLTLTELEQIYENEKARKSHA